MEGIFIIGVDTGVGKSSVAAGILKLLQGSRKVCYWKPIQTGTIVADDTKEIKNLTSLPENCFIEPTYRFAEPLSPYMAAKKWGKRVELSELVNTFSQIKKDGYFPILEGAGGLLVPYNETELQVDFAKKIKLPIIFITEDRVGAINQVLLSLSYAREQGLEVLGVIITRSRRTLGNAESISHFGKVEILAEFDPTEDHRNLVAQVGGNERLRELFQTPKLPQ